MFILSNSLSRPTRDGPSAPPKFKRNLDGSACRDRFRVALLSLRAGASLPE
jgi:hypothetical protein